MQHVGMIWYALRTAPQKEFALVEILSRYAIQTFCPTETKWKRVGPKKKRTPCKYAMLPRYIFATGANPWDIVRDHRHRGIQGVVSFDGRPAAISEAAIERLARMSGAAMPTRSASVHRSFTPGDKVEIVAGPFQGWLVPIESIKVL